MHEGSNGVKGGIKEVVMSSCVSSRTLKCTSRPLWTSIRSTTPWSCLPSTTTPASWRHSTRSVIRPSAPRDRITDLTSDSNVVGSSQACGRFINNNAVTRMAQSSSKSPELLARYCDSLLKKRCCPNFLPSVMNRKSKECLE